jgi:hypothetical protein
MAGKQCSTHSDVVPHHIDSYQVTKFTDITDMTHEIVTGDCCGVKPKVNKYYGNRVLVSVIQLIFGSQQTYSWYVMIKLRGLVDNPLPSKSHST